MNAALHSLANTAGPFSAELGPLNQDFVPHVAPNDEALLRGKLCLDLGDYYLKHLLVNLQTRTDLWRNVSHGGDVFQVDLLPKPKVTSEGGSLMSLSRGVGYYNEQTLLKQVPVSMDWELAWRADKLAVIRDVTSGRTTTTKVVPSLESLRVVWPVWVPFSGPIQLTQSWVAGALISFHVEPSGFPWSVLAERIKGDSWLNQHLTDHQLMDEFHSGDARLQVALACACVIQAHPWWRLG